MLRDEVYFLVRYTPFWSIPLFLLGAEFFYLFWVRKKKKPMTFCLMISVFSLVCTVAYYIAGGPEKSVDKFMNLIWYFTR